MSSKTSADSVHFSCSCNLLDQSTYVPLLYIPAQGLHLAANGDAVKTSVFVPRLKNGGAVYAHLNTSVHGDQRIQEDYDRSAQIGQFRLVECGPHVLYRSSLPLVYANWPSLQSRQRMRMQVCVSRSGKQHEEERDILRKDISSWVLCVITQQRRLAISRCRPR